MSKRRVFDIDFDVDESSVPAGTEGDGRRGPMAAAISENASALTERQQAEAAIRAENDRLAHEYVSLKKDGAIVARVPLSEVRTSKLIRDRSATRDPELDELKASIRAIGLSNPIHVEDTGSGYELVQGFRRLSAYRELFEETGDDSFARIPATLQAKGAELDLLYRRMVDENLVRRDISFAEMAQLALSYAAKTSMTPRDAVDVLFASSGRQKRSYIRHFTVLLHQLGDSLEHAEAIPRSLGLKLVKALDETPRLAAQIKAVLSQTVARTAEVELQVLAASLAAEKPAKAAPAPAPAPRASAKTTIRLNRPEGVAKCTASQGRIEVQLDRDFGSMDARRLESALRSFLDQLSSK